MNAAEINSSFHRPHRESTYRRWRESVPDDFRFSVKIPKAITHTARLSGVEHLLDAFIGSVRGLDESLGCLLVQLPPSLIFDEVRAAAFFTLLRSQYDGAVSLEPRNESWFARDVDAFLTELRISRVVADPAKPEGAVEPGGSSEVRYFRLHGSPRMYYSSYNESYLIALAERIRIASSTGATWCIFDNTTLGAAMPNALDLTRLLAGPG